MISVRIHNRDGERILAACDHELLGQTFTGDGTRLKVSEIFYGGETVTEGTFAERMKNVTIMNLVGDRTIEMAKAAGYVSDDSVIVIGSVKHAQVVIM
jgi:hypothetical protein